MNNRSRKILWLLIVIDYQYQSIIDGNRWIKCIDYHRLSISHGLHCTRHWHARSALWECRLFVILPHVAPGHLFTKDVWHFAGKWKKKTVLCSSWLVHDYYYDYYYYGYLHFYLIHRLPFGFRTIAGWQKKENMYQGSTVRQPSLSEKTK